MATILITGGSGLIGTALTQALIASGHTVRHIGRSARRSEDVKGFVWDLDRGTMDAAALHGVDHIVHLAGAGIADERWTSARVQELIHSRTASARLLLTCARTNGIRVKSFVSAAGINYYGAATTEHVYTEDDMPGTDTIARISKEWEAAVDEWTPHTRVVKLRTPIVLSPTGGALAKLVAPVRWGLGTALGSGEQWMPWVHIDDLVRIYELALADDRFVGAYNVNTGNDVTNQEFMRTAAQVLDKPYFLPHVPAFMLRAVLGDLASILLGGSRASSQRLSAKMGYRFKHPLLTSALTGLLP